MCLLPSSSCLSCFTAGQVTWKISSWHLQFHLFITYFIQIGSFSIFSCMHNVINLLLYFLTKNEFGFEKFESRCSKAIENISKDVAAFLSFAQIPSICKLLENHSSYIHTDNGITSIPSELCNQMTRMKSLRLPENVFVDLEKVEMSFAVKVGPFWAEFLSCPIYSSLGYIYILCFITLNKISVNLFVHVKIWMIHKLYKSRDCSNFFYHQQRWQQNKCDFPKCHINK